MVKLIGTHYRYLDIQDFRLKTGCHMKHKSETLMPSTSLSNRVVTQTGKINSQNIFKKFYLKIQFGFKITSSLKIFSQFPDFSKFLTEIFKFWHFSKFLYFLTFPVILAATMFEWFVTIDFSAFSNQVDFFFEKTGQSGSCLSIPIKSFGCSAVCHNLLMHLLILCFTSQSTRGP